MASITIGDLSGAAVSQTPTSFTVTHADGYSERYAGTGFTYSGSVVTGGTLTDLTTFDNTGAEGVRFTSINAPVASFIAFVNLANTPGALGVLLGGPDQVSGTGDVDVLLSQGGDDFVSAGAGNDYANGMQGNDTVHGNEGTDTMLGGQGSDWVFGDEGADVHINGNMGDDHVFGGQGADTVYGGQGNDTVDGDDGDDRVSGDQGDDLLTGGAGADRFIFKLGSGNDVVDDFNFAAGDRLQLALGTVYSTSTVGADVLISWGSDDTVLLAGNTAYAFADNWIVFA
jgi:Ca2+-binding RTX toxin-like protein